MFLQTCQLIRGERGGWEQAAGKKKTSLRAKGAFTEFRFCVLSADAAEP